MYKCTVKFSLLRATYCLFLVANTWRHCACLNIIIHLQHHYHHFAYLFAASQLFTPRASLQQNVDRPSAAGTRTAFLIAAIISLPLVPAPRIFHMQAAASRLWPWTHSHPLPPLSYNHPAHFALDRENFPGQSPPSRGKLSRP